jgi:hypothetical protein
MATLADVNVKRTEMNSAIDAYKQAVLDFADGLITRANLDSALSLAQNEGDAFAWVVLQAKRDNPSLFTDEFFSNPELMGELRRSEIAAILMTGILGNPMVWLVKTDKVDAENATVELSFINFTGTIKWGDGSMEDFVNGAKPSHTYEEPGSYRVRVTGTAEGSYDSSGSLIDDRDWLVDIEAWGAEFIMDNWANAFDAKRNFSVTATDEPHFRTASDASNMFRGTSLVEPLRLAHWTTTNIANANSFFANSTGMTDDLSTWDLSRAIDENAVSDFALNSDINPSQLPTLTP